MFIWVQTERLLDVHDVVEPERSTVGRWCSCLARAKSNDGANVDERRLVATSGIQERMDDAANVRMAIKDIDNTPTSCLHLFVHVFPSICDIGGAIARNIVVIIDDTKIVELPVTG